MINTLNNIKIRKKEIKKENYFFINDNVYMQSY